MREPLKLKVRHCAAHIIGLNDFSYAFPGAKARNKIGDTELNKIIMNTVKNVLSNKVYMQGFYCGSIFLKLSACLNVWKLRKLVL